MDADGLLRGRRGNFSTSGLICVASVALSVPIRCPWKLGDEGGPMDADGLLLGRRDTFSTSGWICVAVGDEGGPMDADGLLVTLSAPQA